MRDSEVILAKDINLDNSYSNVLNYTESQMLTLLRSSEHVVYQQSNYSFVKENTNKININAPYNTCINANYIAFQNKSYNNKWFFAFIIDVEYTSNASTTITFEIDAFSTWFNNLTVKPCFIEREHVNDDAVGAHTIPEGLEKGEYISSISGNVELNDTFQEQSIVMAVTIDNELFPDVNSRFYGGCFSGTVFIEFSGLLEGQAGAFLKAMNSAGKLDAITSIFMLPSFLLDVSGYSFNFGSVIINCNIVNSTRDADEFSIPIGTKPSTIGSYTPKNKKLLTSDYSFLLIDNGVGGTKKYNFEDFNTSGSQGTIFFDCLSTPVPSGSIIYAPRNYKNKTPNYLESFAGAKFPMCSWNSDPYINWLTQSGVNRSFNYAKDALATTLGIGATVMGFATGNPLIAMAGISGLSGGVTSTLSDVVEDVKERKIHDIAPSELQGNETLGDVVYAYQRCIPKYYYMHIKEEYARIIDDFFSRFGYQVNRVKVPNITGRSNWNYVKIANGEDIGNGTIPNKYKDIINKIFRAGTTIWHNHDNIGNFNLNNNII